MRYICVGPPTLTHTHTPQTKLEEVHEAINADDNGECTSSDVHTVLVFFLSARLMHA